MISLRPFIGAQSAFQPNELDAMSKAFDDVCVRLQIAPDESDDAKG